MKLEEKDSSQLTEKESVELLLEPEEQGWMSRLYHKKPQVSKEGIIPPVIPRGKVAHDSVKSGLGNTHPGKVKAHGLTAQTLGCDHCTWIGTTLCPFKLQPGQRAEEGTCSTRIMFAKETMAVAGTMPKYLQVEQAFLLREMKQDLYKEYVKTRKVSKELLEVMKTENSLHNSMRAQEEGLKMVHESNESMEKFRKVVDVEYSKIESDEEPK